VNATLGFINLAALYGTFSVLCLVAPPLLASLEASVGLRSVMIAGSVAYAAMIISNIYTKHWALPISMNVLVGCAAPLLWTCQNDYVGRCAFHHATQTNSLQGGAGADGGNVSFEERFRLATAAFNGLFFSIYQFSGSLGNIASSLILLGFGDQNLKNAEVVLFIVLTCVSCAGAAVFLLLPNVKPGGEQAGSELPSAIATARLAFSNFRVTLLIPLMLTNGMLIAFVTGDFATDVTCPVAGSSFTGFVVATFFFCNSMATLFWGKMVGSKKLSRFWAYILATMLQVGFLVLKLFWERPANFEHTDGTWTKRSEADWKDVVIVFALVSLFAVGDAFWESGPPGTLQNFFSGSGDVVAALANYKLWQSLGFAAQFVIGAELGDYPQLRAGILIGLCCVSAVCVVVLNSLAPLE
jgi:hypothetical protein